VEALVERCTEVIAGELLPRLRGRFLSVLGEESSAESPWGLLIDEDDKQMLNFSYPPGIASDGPMPSYLGPVIRLELGARSDQWPAEKHLVRSYASEVFPDVFEEPTCEVDTSPG
jgi:hypothetical protein